MLSSEQRKTKERLFHDKLRYNAFGQRWSSKLEELIDKDPLWVNMKYYSIERKSRNFVLSWLLENCRGKDILDYCCGNGEDAIFVAQNGASKIIGIDISEVSISNCRARVYSEKFSEITSFQVMDAENLKFNDNYFDIVSEYGALHHLNLKKAYAQIARVLRPEGKCICTEALRHNPFIHTYRKITPKLRTDWEVDHILGREDIMMAKKYFDDVRILGFFHLAVLGAVPFRNSSVFGSILRVLEGVDNFLLRLPIIKWYAWQVVFLLSNPKNNHS